MYCQIYIHSSVKSTCLSKYNRINPNKDNKQTPVLRMKPSKYLNKFGIYDATKQDVSRCK